MNMPIEVADRIKKNWGLFLEHTHGILQMVFLGKIPESLLPYPKDKIAEALIIIRDEFEKRGDGEAVSAVDIASSFLEFYEDDKEAWLNFVNILKRNSKFLPILTDSLKIGQNENLEKVTKG